MRLKQWMQTAVALGAGLAAMAQGASAATEFSAEMLGRAPDGQTTSGRMYVGDGRMRVEMTREGREMVRIVDRDQGREWLLLPAQRVYMERSLPPQAGNDPLPAPSAERNPCAGLPEMNCRRAGEETVGGRAAVKWEMTISRDGQTLTGAQWLDVERGLPLKYEMPDGRRMELHLVGEERLDGRQVEKWEVTASAPNQQPTRTFQWFDPELGLAVREEFPGGYVRELDAIRVGPQPDHLFSVPEGYSRAEPQQQR
ncbi:hypothetical protein [Marichromatium sp. AB32]|uniref:hypothetical protein n=1 Tax=Marichromatium sp. AB32 TaxID=2483363 RepID=UPI000F3BA3EF|nr:hypothetical protein [Marichromatium sp. AB32]RNE94211.1 hypothetical protein EBL85_03035 [Marichromatium sp. AB32]